MFLTSRYYFFMELKYNEIKNLREKLLKEQNYICPLCKRKIKKPVLDHAHKSNGHDGCVRMVLCSGCNVFAGKLENNYKRYELDDDALKEFLKNFYDYVNKKHTDILHPKDNKKKKEKLSKRKYNKVIKYWDQLHPRAKKPKYQEYLNKKWKIIFKELDEYLEYIGKDK